MWNQICKTSNIELQKKTANKGKSFRRILFYFCKKSKSLLRGKLMMINSVKFFLSSLFVLISILVTFEQNTNFFSTLLINREKPIFWSAKNSVTFFSLLLFVTLSHTFLIRGPWTGSRAEVDKVQPANQFPEIEKNSGRPYTR